MVVVVFTIPATAQLSQNSGINANDTWVLFDATFQSQGTSTLPLPVYNAATGTTSSTQPGGRGAVHFHVEAGYDANDGMVLNLVPTDPPGDPTRTPVSRLGKIHLAGGAMTAYDRAGNSIPIVLPRNAPLPQPLAFLGFAPGHSVVDSIVQSDPQALATMLGATVTFNNQNTPKQAAVSGVRNPYNVGSPMNLNYQSAGSVWVLNQVAYSATSTNKQFNGSVQLANVVYNVNSSGDGRRLLRSSTASKAPMPATKSYPPPAISSTCNGSPSLQTLAVGNGSNMAFQHGVGSSGAAWGRMEPWLAADYQFGTVQLPTLPWCSAISV